MRCHVISILCKDGPSLCRMEYITTQRAWLQKRLFLRHLQSHSLVETSQCMYRRKAWARFSVCGFFGSQLQAMSRLSLLLDFCTMKAMVQWFKRRSCLSHAYSHKVQGKTRVALYGLGNLRDERLGRLFQIPGRVTWWVFVPQTFRFPKILCTACSWRHKGLNLRATRQPLRIVHLQVCAHSLTALE